LFFSRFIFIPKTGMGLPETGTTFDRVTELTDHCHKLAKKKKKVLSSFYLLRGGGYHLPSVFRKSGRASLYYSPLKKIIFKSFSLKHFFFCEVGSITGTAQ